VARLVNLSHGGPSARLTPGIGTRVQRFTVALVAGLSVCIASIIMAPAAGAWPGDPAVYVTGGIAQNPCKNDWMWFRATSGESGWASWNGTRWSFMLRGVPAFQSVNVTLKLGNHGGSCVAMTSFAVSRPTWGTQVAVGARTFYRG
jgi:hypothetical protein